MMFEAVTELERSSGLMPSNLASASSVLGEEVIGILGLLLSCSFAGGGASIPFGTGEVFLMHSYCSSMYLDVAGQGSSRAERTLE
jgi:hypothetical protein